MRRAFIFALFAAVAQTKNAQTSSKHAARQELSPPPVVSANAPAISAHASPYNFHGVQYPRIEADSRVTFHFTAPDAKKVQVALVTPGQNSLTPLPYDMGKGDDGVWTYTSAPRSPGYHNYWMLVDGAIVLDPSANTFMGYGHMCNGFEIPEPGVDFYELKDVPHGSVRIENYFSKTADSWRRIFVYAPPGYDSNTRLRYPVLYLQHGGGLLAAGKAKPFIVVMETSAVGAPTPGRGMMGAPGGGAFGKLMINDLIPWVDTHFRTLTDKDHRGMAGLSMGGGMTASVTMANLDKFSYIGLFSGGAATGGGRGRGGAAPTPAANPAPLDLKTVYSGAMANPSEFNKKVKVLFMSFGTEPPLENPDGLKRHQEQLVAAGIANSYVYFSPGTTHEWQSWRRSLYTFAQLLFK